jgi:hypothetical protein
MDADDDPLLTMKTFAFYLCTFALALATGCTTAPRHERRVTLPYPVIEYAP